MQNSKLLKKKLIRHLGLGSTIIFSIALVFFLLRGPYLSNSIKRLIQPAMEEAIREKIIIDKAVINLFPFYLQTKGFKVFDGEGNKLVSATKMRAYIDLIGLFSKEIRIRRLTVKEPELTTDKKTLEKIIDSIEKYTRRDNGRHFGISVKSMKITDGKFTLADEEKQMTASGQGLYVEVVVKDEINVVLSLKNGVLKLPDLPELSAGLDGKIKLRDREIKISGARIYSSDSTIEAKGEMRLSSEGKMKYGFLSGKANISMKTISKIFKLEEKKDGMLSFSGSIDLLSAQEGQGIEMPRFKFNLKTKSWFYLETLMELLKVHENITGRISINGEIQGVYPEVIGRGIGKLENAVLDNLPIDDAAGEIRCENKKISLKNFVAHTYGGELKGNAFLLMPNGDYFIDAQVMNVNSPLFFKFIEWEPPFPEGKINGSFRLNKTPGRKIELTAEADYLNTSENRENLLRDRLKNIKAYIALKNDILTFNRAFLSTPISELLLNGSIDLNKEKLNLNIYMESRDASDLTVPYFSDLKAPVKFTGKANGATENPEISGDVRIGPGTINGISFTEVTGDLTYNPKSLSVGLLKIKQENSIYETSGSIAFRKTKGLFSFEDPYYNGSALIKNGDAKSLIAVIYKEIPITGFINGRLSFKGDTKEFKGEGDITLEGGMVFNQSIDRAFIKATLSPENISFSSVELYRDSSRLKADGSVYFDERFNVSVSSDSVNLRDIAVLNKYPVDANFSLDIKGSGTFKNPDIKFSLNVLKSYFRNALIGEGEIKGELKGNRLFVKGDFLRGTVTADANVLLSKTLPWDINMRFKNGRYDFLLAGFLKDVPRDLSASLEGVVRLQGDRNKFSMNSKFNTLNFNLYGYNFKNKEDIVLEFIEETFKIKSFAISGVNGDITATGTVKIGQNYNLAVRGRLNLASLKGAIKIVEFLKGHGNFVAEITGSWKSPELKGAISIRDVSVMLSGLPYKIGPVNGDILLDKDRITLDSFKADFAGGKVVLSGVGRLEGLSLKGLYISSELEGLRFKPVEGADVAFDGKLFFESSPKRQSLLGDINIKKARYEKRVEWKSWLIRLKEVKEIPIEQPSFLGKTVLNVHVTGQDNIFIDNNIARTPVKIDLNVQGSIAQYGLIGKVEAVDGTIFFRGNEFKIIKGSVDFVEPNRIVPVFHIQAETFTSGYRVRLNLDGPSDKFILSFFSNPPLSDVDILTLLTAGQIRKESKGFESSIGAGEATAFLTGRLQDVMEERVKYITGFERFEINPYTTATGAVSPGITVGKRLLEENLFVTYSASVGTTEESIIKIQYDLSKNFSIVGIKDEIGSVGADFKFRFEFK